MAAEAPATWGSGLVVAREFTDRLTTLLANEHASMVDFLVALAEFDRQRLWAELGYASLFDFLHRELGTSKGAAFYRSKGAMLVQRFPHICEPLRDGRLCLSSLGEIAKVITEENEHEVLPRFFHRSSREAKEVAAAIAPQTAPARRDVITTIVTEPASYVAGLGWAARSLPAHAGDHGAPRSVPATPQEDGGAAAAPSRPPAPAANLSRGRAEFRQLPAADHVEPLTASLRRVHMTVSDRWVQKLEALRLALSHSHPEGRAEEITEYALDIALEHVAKKKGTVGNKRRPSRAGTRRKVPRAPQPPRPSDSRARRSHLPAEVRRTVMTRDGGRCQWMLHDGTICGSKMRTQIDHVHPVALGGSSTPDNLRVLCARHNQLAARRVFGERWMDQFASGPR